MESRPSAKPAAIEGPPRDVDDTAAALRAKAQLARRRADLLRGETISRRAQARDLREAADRAVEAARHEPDPRASSFECHHCSATWTAQAIRDGSKRGAVCLLCGRPVTPMYEA